jgi:hypothetical protein
MRGAWRCGLWTPRTSGITKNEKRKTKNALVPSWGRKALIPSAVPPAIRRVFDAALSAVGDGGAVAGAPVPVYPSLVVRQSVRRRSAAGIRGRLSASGHPVSCRPLSPTPPELDCAVVLDYTERAKYAAHRPVFGWNTYSRRNVEESFSPLPVGGVASRMGNCLNASIGATNNLDLVGVGGLAARRGYKLTS